MGKGQKPLGEFIPNFLWWYVVDIRDVITCFKFGDDRFRGLASAEGQILPFPIDLTVVLTTLSHYRVSVWCVHFHPVRSQHILVSSVATRCVSQQVLQTVIGHKELINDVNDSASCHQVRWRHDCCIVHELAIIIIIIVSWTCRLMMTRQVDSVAERVDRVRCSLHGCGADHVTCHVM